MRISFIISGFQCDPDLVSDALNIKPTEVYRVGDRPYRRAPDRVVAENTWRLESEVGDDSELGDHTEWLFERLPKDLGVLQAVADRWDSQLSIAMDTDGSFGSLNLGEDVVDRLGHLNSSIDVNVYFLDME